MATTLIPGSSYQVVDDARIGTCLFRKGDVFTFSSGGYSPYDDCYVYHFANAAGEKRMCTSSVALTEAELRTFEQI